jgi:hypothetical protein
VCVLVFWVAAGVCPVLCLFVCCLTAGGLFEFVFVCMFCDCCWVCVCCVTVGELYVFVYVCVLCDTYGFLCVYVL